MTPTKRALLTLVKYLGWTAAGAVVVEAINMLPQLQLPDVAAVVVGGVLKFAATYIATRKAEYYGT